MKCDRLTAADGISGPRMVRCQDEATDQVRDATGRRMGVYCEPHADGTKLHPGWTRESLRLS